MFGLIFWVGCWLGNPYFRTGSNIPVVKKKKKTNIFVTHFVGVVGVVIEIVVAAMQFSMVVQCNVIWPERREALGGPFWIWCSNRLLMWAVAIWSERFLLEVYVLVFVFNKLQVWTLDSALSHGSLPSHVHRIQLFCTSNIYSVLYFSGTNSVSYTYFYFFCFVLFCFVLF